MLLQQGDLALPSVFWHQGWAEVGISRDSCGEGHSPGLALHLIHFSPSQARAELGIHARGMIFPMSQVTSLCRAGLVGGLGWASWEK